MELREQTEKNRVLIGEIHKFQSEFRSLEDRQHVEALIKFSELDDQLKKLINQLKDARVETHEITDSLMSEFILIKETRLRIAKIMCHLNIQKLKANSNIGSKIESYQQKMICEKVNAEKCFEKDLLLIWAGIFNIYRSMKAIRGLKYDIFNEKVILKDLKQRKEVTEHFEDHLLKMMKLREKLHKDMTKYFLKCKNYEDKQYTTEECHSEASSVSDQNIPKSEFLKHQEKWDKFKEESESKMKCMETSRVELRSSIHEKENKNQKLIQENDELSARHHRAEKQICELQCNEVKLRCQLESLISQFESESATRKQQEDEKLKSLSDTKDKEIKGLETKLKDLSMIITGKNNESGVVKTEIEYFQKEWNESKLRVKKLVKEVAVKVADVKRLKEEMEKMKKDKENHDKELKALSERLESKRNEVTRQDKKTKHIEKELKLVKDEMSRLSSLNDQVSTELKQSKEKLENTVHMLRDTKTEKKEADRRMSMAEDEMIAIREALRTSEELRDVVVAEIDVLKQEYQNKIEMLQDEAVNVTWYDGLIGGEHKPNIDSTKEIETILMKEK